MKQKLLVVTLLLLIGTQVAQGQALKQAVNRAALRHARAVPIPVPASNEEAPASRAAHPTPPAPATLATPARWGRMLGFTTFDLQTNRSMPNRLAVTGNLISAAWNQSCLLSAAPASGDRGVGFNGSNDGGVTLFDSASHCTPYGIAALRTGWPEVLHVNGQEVIFAHLVTQAQQGIVQITRATGPTGWSTSAVLPFTVDPLNNNFGLWPRAVNDGASIHLVYCSYGSTTIPQQPSEVINPVLYSRSLDGGLTWDLQNVNLPQFDSSNFDSVGGDNYAIAVNGQHVAITAGCFGNNTLLAKSMDGGTTFATRRIMGPFTAADTIQLPGQRAGSDTAAIVAPDGSVQVVIDNSGTTHWFSGAQLIQAYYDRASGYFKPTGSYFPDVFQGVLYWNDRELLNAKPAVVAYTDTVGQVFGSPWGVSQAYNIMANLSMPTAATDANGDVYCIYANGQRGQISSITGHYYRDLYLLKLAFPGNGTVVAYVPNNISRDLRGVPGGAARHREESVYPSAEHRVINGRLHYTWMSDSIPGYMLQPNTVPPTYSAIMYDTIGVSPAIFPRVAFVIRSNPTTGLATAAPAGTELVAVPNPTTGKVALRLRLPQDTRATVVVRNLLGQEVARLPLTELAAGSHNLPLDLSGVSAGVYVCTVQAEGFTLSRRVVRQ